MSKKEFLRILENNLMILEEKERKDIINDYTEMIEEKIKSGQSEKETIDSFGNVDEVSQEILSSYKINTDYNKKKVDAKKVIENSESWIKKTAKNLSVATTEFFDSLKSNRELSVELVFEILIKILILLVVCAILKLPFMVIERLGSGIFGIFDPFDAILIIIWKLLVSVCYLVGCIILFFAFFKNYFKSEENKPKKSNSKLKNSVKSSDDVGIITKDIKSTEYKNNTIINAFKWIVRFFIVICILVPIICANVGLIIGLIYSLFFAIKGINIWGLVILVAGLLVLGWEVYHIVYTLTFKKIKIYLWVLLAGAFLTAIGGMLFVDNVMSFNYYDTVSPNIGEATTTTHETTLLGPTDITYNDLIIDDTLEDNKIKIAVTYYEKFYTIVQENLNHNTRIKVYVSPIDSEFNTFKAIYRIFVKDLKDNSVYNYDIDNYYVTIYANSNTAKLIDN